MSTRARAEKRAAQLLSSNTAPSLASCLWSWRASVFSSIVPVSNDSVATRPRRPHETRRLSDGHVEGAEAMWEKFGNHAESAPAESSLYTWTGRAWPSRQTRAMACSSCAGFQSGSNRSKRLPPTRFRPQPPARVLNKNTNAFEVLDLNLSTSLGRSAGGVVPSTRSQSHPAIAAG